MTTEGFVQIIQRIVRDASVGEVLSVVRNPPGRRPAKTLVELSEWFKALDEGDQRMVTEMMRLVAHQAVFGLLCVLDGSRQVEATPDKGHFELRFVDGTGVSVLSGPDTDPLHEFLE